MSEETKTIKTAEKGRGIDFLDVPKETSHYKQDFINFSGDDLKKFLYGIKGQVETDEYNEWKDMVDIIDRSYYEGMPRQLSNMLAADFDSRESVILTNGTTNKVREMVRSVANILLKNRPRFEPDPSGDELDTSMEDLTIATRFLEYSWDKGGLVTATSSVVKQALRRKIGILKTYFSEAKGDIVFKPISALNFWWDFSVLPENSFFYCEEREISLYEIKLSGVFTSTQFAKIKEELKIPFTEDKGQLGAEYYKKYKVHDFYIKTERDGKIGWDLVTFLNSNILIRKSQLDEDDVPFSFFLVEKEEGAIHEAHSMNDVCNASATANYLNFKILSWIKNLTDVTVVVNEKQKIGRTHTPGVRAISVSSTDGISTSQPVIPPQSSISQDVFFHLERLQRNAENNFGIHPNILQGVNGSTPANGPVAETLLTNDIHNTSLLSQEFQEFLKDVARKILHIAYYKYDKSRTITINPTKSATSEQFNVVGGNLIDKANDEDKEAFVNSGDKVIKKFNSINVKIKPGSAYTEKSQVDKIMNLLQIAPDMMQYIPKASLLEMFAEGSANLMMHQAAREAADAEQQEQNSDIQLAETENKLMGEGQARMPQANENHAVHDRIHLVEETFLQDQLQKASDEKQQQQFAQKLTLVRNHRMAHNQMSGQQQQEEAQMAPASPPVIGAEDDTSELIP